LLSTGPTRIPRPRGLLAAREAIGMIDEELVLLTPDGDDAPAALHHLTQQK
jgi:hypothetical protein